MTFVNPKPMNSQSDELIRKILGARSLDALNSLKHINKDKGDALQRALIQHFYSTQRPISHEEYIQVVDKMEKQTIKPTVDFKRRGNFLELDDI